MTTTSDKQRAVLNKAGPMANGRGGGLLYLLCCFWLFSAASQPRERVVYVQQVGESAEGELPMIACTTMERESC